MFSRSFALIADPDKSGRNSMRSALGRVGLGARFERSGQDALASFMAERPRLVITHAALPDMDGAALAKAIRAQPGCGPMPVLMLTETETLSDEDIRQAYHCGITDIIQNPRNWTLFSYRISYLIRANNAERELSVAHDYMRKAIDLFPGGFVIYDRHERLTLTNRITRERIPDLRLGMSPADAWRSAYRSGRFDTDGISEVEWVAHKIACMDAEGWWETPLVNGGALRVHGGRLEDGSRFCVSIDVTRERQNERRLRAARQEAEDANRIKAQFLSGMSHEVRTPLNAIIGFSEIIQKQIMGPIDNPVYVDYAGDIHQSARHLLDTMTLILDISKVETTPGILVDEEFNLNNALDRAERKYAAPAETREIAVQRQTVGPLYLMGDETRVARALGCLLDNAVKFSPPRTTVRMGTRVAPDGVELWVRDEGMGMAPEDLPQALQLFSQLDDRTDRRFSGMGIGLAYAKTVVEAHGGKVVMDSRPGNGTTVTLSLPLSRLREGGQADMRETG